MNHLPSLSHKKTQLDHHRPLPPALVKNLDDWFRVELTYTSNAIEGNTLTRNETALVIEKGITVGGKTLNEHLEAVNHAEAIEFVQALVGKTHAELTLGNVLEIHRIVLQRIDDVNAAKLRNIPGRIAGAATVLPNPRKVPQLMDEFLAWLHQNDDHPGQRAADAHLRLVTIHPFVDGNGRTARLLMNLLLMQAGYPPAVIRKEDRLAYINAIEQANTEGQREAYDDLIFDAVDRSLDVYLQALTPDP